MVAVVVLAAFALLYLLGYYLGPDKRWRTSEGRPVDEERR